MYKILYYYYYYILFLTSPFRWMLLWIRNPWGNETLSFSALSCHCVNYKIKCFFEIRNYLQIHRLGQLLSFQWIESNYILHIYNMHLIIFYLLVGSVMNWTEALHKWMHMTSSWQLSGHGPTSSYEYALGNQNRMKIDFTTWRVQDVINIMSFKTIFCAFVSTIRQLSQRHNEKIINLFNIYLKLTNWLYTDSIAPLVPHEAYLLMFSAWT